MKKVVNTKHAKSGEYKEVIEKIARQGRCPFCPDNFRYHKNPILKRSRNWFVTKSSWPYKNSQYHLLVIGKNHKEEFTDLDKKDFNEVNGLIMWTINKFKIKGGAVSLRFGNTDYTGATVCHLHFHLISPKKSKSVVFPIG